MIIGGLWLTCICIVLGLKTADQSAGVTQALSQFREGTAEFSSASLNLKKAVSLLDSKDTATLVNAKLALKNSRLSYKKIEFFLNYFFESSAMIYNRPTKAEVDEPYMEYQEPSGFQVMEAMLFDTDPITHQQELIQQADLLCTSAPDLNSLLYNFKGSDEELLESVRLELVRVITLSITGYDAPELKTGIVESYQSLAAIRQILLPYLNDAFTISGSNLHNFNSTAQNLEPNLQNSKLGSKAITLKSKALSNQLELTLAYLKRNPDFDSFNRMEFITVYALPLQEQLGIFITTLNLNVQGKSILNYQAKNMFSADALLASAFTGDTSRTSYTNLQRTLGKKLFQETALSGNLKRSCQTCHRPEQYFSDGLKTSLAFDGHSNVQRNAPSLIYAGYQYAQFWDGRVKTLPEQIKAVIANPLEMNGDHAVVVSNLKRDPAYQRDFKQAFPSSGSDPVTLQNLSVALSGYILGLAPMNSSFDQYVAGNKVAMTAEQVKGFNLFMGKGQCGSCHFAPLFNGLIPPLYKLTEYEILGTPANDDFEHLQPDTDKGRYGFFPISYYKAAFKTPTVRNSAMTAPYMHNGVFKDLNKVVEFYNQGGGAGLGLPVAEQTLSAKPLHLSKEEVNQIVVFMQSLTDKID